MSHDEALLQAVIEAPDDDAPRLLYAEWLEGRGDPRGEFIRVQLDLARLPANDPSAEALRHRERELLDRHAWEWAEPLGGRVSEWVFQRGFIERVGTSLEVTGPEILELLRLAPIRHVRDTGQFCELDGFVDILPHLGRLTGLEFWGLYAFEDEKVRAILETPYLADLQTLILHHDRNGDLVDDDVIIRWLDPPRARQRYLPGMGHPPRRARLRELAVNVDGCWRGPSARIVRAMAGSPLLGELRKLNLSHAELDLETVDHLGRSSYLTRLEELDLGGCSFTREIWDAILRLPQLGRLKWLRLHWAGLIDVGGKHVGDLGEIPRYREAFEGIATNIDWDTDSIHPWGKGCWVGYSWKEKR